MDIKALGWDAAFEEAFRERREAGFEPARITSLQGNLYTAMAASGEFRGRVSGRMRYECAESGDHPVVGDWVAVKGNPETGLMAMCAVLPRRTRFVRADYNKGAYKGDQAVCANLDVLFVVVALDQEFSANRLERYVAQAKATGAKTVIVLNKADICDDVEGALRAERFENYKHLQRELRVIAMKKSQRSRAGGAPLAFRKSRGVRESY